MLSSIYNTHLRNMKICSWVIRNNTCLIFPLYSQKIFVDLQAEGFPVIETSTLTEEGVIKVKTEVSAPSLMGRCQTLYLSFSCFRKVSHGESFLSRLMTLRTCGGMQAPSTEALVPPAPMTVGLCRDIYTASTGHFNFVHCLLLLLTCQYFHGNWTEKYSHGSCSEIGKK